MVYVIGTVVGLCNSSLIYYQIMECKKISFADYIIESVRIFIKVIFCKENCFKNFINI